jgi:hypothetical protein
MPCLGFFHNYDGLWFHVHRFRFHAASSKFHVRGSSRFRRRPKRVFPWVTTFLHQHNHVIEEGFLFLGKFREGINETIGRAVFRVKLHGILKILGDEFITHIQ